MKTALIATLFVAVGVLSVMVHSHTVAFREQLRQSQELNAKLESRLKRANLELQEKCAKQAYEAFKINGYEQDKMAGFTNHYNEKLNRCFVEIENTSVNSGTISTYKSVSDAFEGKGYGSYGLHTDKKKKYWEVPPFECKVTLPSGEEQICRSSDEFDALIKNNYME